MPIKDLFGAWANHHERALEPGKEYLVRVRYRSEHDGAEFRVPDQ